MKPEDLNLADEIMKEAVICHQGEWLSPTFKKSL
jgi:hypothetical protein